MSQEYSYQDQHAYTSENLNFSERSAQQSSIESVDQEKCYCNIASRCEDSHDKNTKKYIHLASTKYPNKRYMHQKVSRQVVRITQCGNRTIRSPRHRCMWKESEYSSILQQGKYSYHNCSIRTPLYYFLFFFEGKGLKEYHEYDHSNVKQISMMFFYSTK